MSSPHLLQALMLAFHFPPFAQSSGSIRTLSFVRNLPQHGWHPVVLTARPHAYAAVDPESTTSIPSDTQVIRASGLDVARHLSIAGRYPTALATPDRWNTWAIGAVFAGLAFVRRTRPKVLWATFPIASAVVAAVALHRLSGIPLVLDLRDPMLYEGWPADRWMRATYQRIERRAIAMSSATVVTTPGAQALYAERYPQASSKFRVIANGVDDIITIPAAATRDSLRPLTLLHSGLMEIPDRDPTAFFEAIAILVQRGEIAADRLRVVLRATGRDDQFRRQIDALGIGAIVSVEGRVPHVKAIAEMQRADGLLLFQGAACNRQIPAKAYEYLACRRPIIGLLDGAGDTHRLIAEQWRVPYIANMQSAPEIAAVLRRFILDHAQREVFIPSADLVRKHSRAAAAAELASLFDRVAAERINA